MKQNALVVVVALCAAGLLFAADGSEFALKIAPASSVLTGAAGSTATASFDYAVTLDSTIDEVQGWSFGMILQPAAGTTMAISALAVANDTMVCGPSPDDDTIPGGKPGFQDTAFFSAGDLASPKGKAKQNGTCPLIDSGGNPVTDVVAVTQGIVVDNYQKVSLPKQTGFELITFTVTVTATIGENPAELGQIAFTDAVGSPATSTVIVYGGGSFVPAIKAPAVITSEKVSCKPKADFTIAVGNASIAATAPEATEWPEATLAVYLNFDSDPADETAKAGETAIQGWSYSVCVDDISKSKVVSATITGTETATVNGGEKAGFITLTVETDGSGVSQAIVVDMYAVNTLPAKNGYYDLSMTVAAALPAPTDEANPPKAFFYPCSDVFGEPPVAAVMVIDGGSFASSQYFGTNPADPSAGCCDPVICNQPGYVFTTAGDKFVPGSANGDGRLDIADAIYLLSYLFRSGPALPCDKAGDANGDCALDATDAVYLIQYQFLDGPPPPLGVGCQTVPKDVCPALTCEASESKC